MARETTLRSKQTRHARNGVRIKTIALPAEHGGWGLVFEPVVLGLLLAPSFAGFYLALSAVALFLSRQPLTLLMLNRTRESPRTALARRFATLYLGISVASFIAAVVFAQFSFALPLLIAAPFAMVQLVYDWRGRRRVLLAELSGATAISSLATAIALCGGWSNPAAFALWAIMIARAVPAILYVRAVLGRLHNKQASSLPMLAAHALGVVAVALLFRGGLAPRLAIGAMLVLTLRALIAFASARRSRLTAMQLGFSEIAFGALTILASALGITFKI
ncbi:MAG TPA: YwiC-like family protein [Pyrinomonadaceae bacterium]|nr:YwiC-like family protein [Pyrinomonadaceae bacterium]